MSRSGSISAIAGRLGEDWRWALEDTWFSAVGGSKWTPRIIRRLIYHIGGASMQSAPGMKFVFAGRPRNLTIGRGVYMNSGVFVEAIAPVTVGDACSLGMQVMILTSHHPVDPVDGWQDKPEGRGVTIGERVWIGARAIVLPGAVIESDVVIAAGAIVTGKCLSRGIYAGVPARRIRDFDDMTGS